MWYMYTIKFYPSLKKEKMYVFAGKWMQVETVMLDKFSRIKNIVCSLTYWPYISLRCTKFCGSVTWKLKRNLLGEWRDVKGMKEGGKERAGEAMKKSPDDLKHCVQWICAQKDPQRENIRIILYLYQIFCRNYYL